MAVSIVTNEDNMKMMARYPDKFFDLAIVDPPYGINITKQTLGNGKRKVNRGATDWDNSAPPKEYFIQLMRVSKNQIIWGANHFISLIPINSPAWVLWDKGTGDNDFADGELAWTSFKSALRIIKKSWVGANAKEKGEIDRMHPTQKPIFLYKRLLELYAKHGQKILDTHLGSGSSRIGAYDLGFDFYGCELDKDYFDAQEKRFQTHIKQQKLFAPAINYAEQTTLL